MFVDSGHHPLRHRRHLLQVYTSNVEKIGRFCYPEWKISKRITCEVVGLLKLRAELELSRPLAAHSSSYRGAID
ncbi:hypothetical protein LINGRAHAP2_LOCUS37034, partial [Linum grandiflorum]